MAVDAEAALSDRRSPERGDDRGERLELGGGAVDVDGDDRLVDARLGVLAIAADVLLDRPDDGRIALLGAGGLAIWRALSKPTERV